MQERNTFAQDFEQQEKLTNDEYNKARFSVFQLTQQQHLSTVINPMCVKDCRDVDKQDQRLVFNRDELECVQNCINKYRMSQSLLIGSLALSE